jgi:hypothetical protein
VGAYPVRADSEPSEPLELKQKALTFEPPPGTGALYVFRIGGPEGAGYRVLLDGVNTGLLRNSQYFYDVLPPGPHNLGGNTVRFTVEPGANYFFMMKQGFVTQTIEGVTEAEGKEYARTLKLSGENHYAPTATVLLKIALAKTPHAGLLSSAPDLLLKVVDLATKQTLTWPMAASGWVVVNAPLGSYLIESIEANSYGAVIVSESVELRWHIEVSRPNEATYYGTITPGMGFPVEKEITPEVQSIFQNLTVKRTALTTAEIIAEP